MGNIPTTDKYRSAIMGARKYYDREYFTILEFDSFLSINSITGFSADAVCHHFGSWEKALRYYGLDFVNGKKDYDNKKVEERKEQVAQSLYYICHKLQKDGKSLSRPNYDKYRKMYPQDDKGRPIATSSAVLWIFETWINSLIETGIISTPIEPTTENIIHNLRTVANQMNQDGRITEKDYKNSELHLFSVDMIGKVMGSWTKAVLNAGLKPSRQRKQERSVFDKVQSETDASIIQGDILRVQETLWAQKGHRCILSKQAYIEKGNPACVKSILKHQYPGGFRQALLDCNITKESVTRYYEEVLSGFKDYCNRNHIDNNKISERLFSDYLLDHEPKLRSYSFKNFLGLTWLQLKSKYLEIEQDYKYSAVFDEKVLLQDLCHMIEQGQWPTVGNYRNAYKEGHASISYEVIYRNVKWPELLKKLKDICTVGDHSYLLDKYNQLAPRDISECMQYQIDYLITHYKQTYFDYDDYVEMMKKEREGGTISDRYSEIYTLSQFRSAFKGWDKIFTTRGYDPQKAKEEQIRLKCYQDILSFVRQMGNMPISGQKYKQFRKEHPEQNLASIDLIKAHTEGFSALYHRIVSENNINVLGPSPEEIKKEMIENLRFVAAAIGHKMSKQEYFTHSDCKYKENEIIRLFGGYQKAILAADLELCTPVEVKYYGNKKIIFDAEKCICEIVEYMISISADITVEKYKEGYRAGLFNYSYMTIIKNAKWKDILAEAKSRVIDSSQSKLSPPSNKALFLDLVRVAILDDGNTPTFTRYKDKGNYKSTDKQFEICKKECKDLDYRDFVCPDKNTEEFKEASSIFKMLHLTDDKHYIRRERERGKSKGTRKNRKKENSLNNNRNRYVRFMTVIRSGFRCDLCGQLGLKDDDGFPIIQCHHVVPLKEGGIDTINNCVALCGTCHDHAHRAAKEKREEIEAKLSEKLKNYETEDEGKKLLKKLHGILEKIKNIKEPERKFEEFLREVVVVD